MTEQIKKELTISENGIGFVSKRGLARLCGMSEHAIRYQFKVRQNELPEIGQSLTVYDSEGAQKIRDIVAWQILLYYAAKGKPEAMKSVEFIGGLGMRLWIRHELGWVEPKPLPKKETPNAVEYLEACKTLEEVSNPMLRSLLEQRLMEEISSLNALPPADPMCILTVQAKELGYSDAEIGNGSKLGKYIAKFFTPEGKQQHGRYRVNTYRKSEALNLAIHEFFNLS